MDRDRIHAAITQERRNIADLIDDLDEAQLATPSLCTGWDVKTVGAHLVSILAEGTLRVTWLGVRRRSEDRAIDEMARRTAQLPAAEIAATLRELADRTYWRPPPQAPGLLAEVLSHSGDIRIPLGLSFEPEGELTATALDFLTGPVPIGLIPPRRLRGIRLQATDMDRTWGEGPVIRGRAAELLMATVGRTSMLDALDGPGLPLLRQRISGWEKASKGHAVLNVLALSLPPSAENLLYRPRWLGGSSASRWHGKSCRRPLGIGGLPGSTVRY